MQTVDTFHAIDDAPHISPPEYLLHFVEAFVFPILLRNLSEDGREARFRIYQHSLGEPHVKRANRIIGCLRMPLVASLEVRKVGGLIFETTLIVKYTGK